jgi:WD40 repeat protein
MGNTAGSIYIAHSPCPERAGFLKCSGHAGPISQLSWMAGDATLISTGLCDHTILQWKCVFDTTRESGDECGKSGDDSEIDIDNGHQLTGLDTGDVFLLPKKTDEPNTWHSMITPPSNLADEDMSAISASFDLEYTQGVRLGDSRQTLKYNENGEIVYIVSTIGVIFDRNDVRQRFYLGHKNTLISLEVDRLGRIAATGELADDPEIHVWDCKTCDPIVKFQNNHSQGVSSLSFSASGDYLVSLGQDAMHSIGERL